MTPVADRPRPTDRTPTPGPFLRRPTAPRRPSVRPGRTATATAVLAVGALLLGLTACGTSDTGNADGAGGRTVTTKFGKVSVPEKPKRVVALGWGDAETALALGVQPVGQSDWLAFGGDGLGPWAEGRYTKSPKKIGTLEPEYEKIADLRPDLILDTKSSGARERYETLKKIAPTVGVPKGSDQFQISWEQQTKLVAKALGREERARRLIAGNERAFAEAVKAHPEFQGKTVTLGSRTADAYGAYVRGGGRVDFVERLGFRNNPKVEARAGKNFSIPVARENLDMLDADLTVVSPIGVTAEKVRKDPLFRAVPSVRKGHSVVFDDKKLSSAFATDSVLSTPYAVKKVVPVFADALKK